MAYSLEGAVQGIRIRDNGIGFCGSEEGVVVGLLFTQALEGEGGLKGRRGLFVSTGLDF